MASQAPQHRDGPARFPVYARGTQRTQRRASARSCPRGLGRAHPTYDAHAVLASDRLDATEASWFVHAALLIR